MTNKITPSHTAPIDEDISNLTDWVELKTIFSDYNAFNLSDLSSLTEEYEDDENIDFSEQDLDNEESYIKVCDEIANRAKTLGDAYPFCFENNDTEISLHNSAFNIGQWIYLYCLVISHRKADTVNITDFSLTNDDRDILQIASVYAAVGHIGDAFSFGFPRPENSNFFDALKNTFTKMGEGSPLNEVRPGYSSAVKDGEVDIVAWQAMNDGLPGKLFLLGQVATGNNWTDKSIIGAMEYFFGAYFSEKPASKAIPAMFIPFCIEEQYGGSRHQVMQNHSSRFGIIYYRLRLPYYALIGFNKPNNFHRKDESDKIMGFVQQQLGDQLPDTVCTA